MVPFVCEPHRDPIFSERPELLDQPIVRFAREWRERRPTFTHKTPFCAGSVSYASRMDRLGTADRRAGVAGHPSRAPPAPAGFGSGLSARGAGPELRVGDATPPRSRAAFRGLGWWVG